MATQQCRARRIDDPEALFTVKQIAEHDGCSERTVHRAIKAGLLKALRIGPGGRLLRIRRADHEAYRRSHG